MSTLGSLRTLIGDWINQPIDDNGRLTTQRVDRAINDGLVQWAVDTQCFKRRTSDISPVTDQAEYDIPDDFHEILRVWQGDNELTRTDVYELDDMDRSWLNAASGSPAYWLPGNTFGKFRVYAPPDASSTDGFVLYGVVIPTGTVGDPGRVATLVEEEDTCPLPGKFANVPALFGAADIIRKMYQDDQILIGVATQLLMDYKELIDEYNRLSVRDGGMECLIV